MKIQIHKVVLISLWAALPALLLASENDTELFNTIKARKALFAVLYNADDADALTEMYTTDATVIAPNYGPAKGHEEIKAGLVEELALGEGKMELETLEVSRLSDDSAYEIGYYFLKIVLEKGDPIIDEGHYVVVWKLGIDNTWRLHVDTWNTSLPLE